MSLIVVIVMMGSKFFDREEKSATACCLAVITQVERIHSAAHPHVICSTMLWIVRSIHDLTFGGSRDVQEFLLSDRVRSVGVLLVEDGSSVLVNGCSGTVLNVPSGFLVDRLTLLRGGLQSTSSWTPTPLG
jgi:hypothetical protein